MVNKFGGGKTSGSPTPVPKAAAAASSPLGISREGKYSGSEKYSGKSPRAAPNGGSGGSAAAAAAPPPRWWTPIDEVGLWISAQSTRSQIHYDQTNIVNCLLRGEKEWVFIDTRKHWGRLPWECAARNSRRNASAQILRRNSAERRHPLAGTAT